MNRSTTTNELLILVDNDDESFYRTNKFVSTNINIDTYLWK